MEGGGGGGGAKTKINYLMFGGGEGSIPKIN